MKNKILALCCVLILSFSMMGQAFAAEYNFTDQDILADLQFCDSVGYVDPFSVFGVETTRQMYADYLVSMGVSPYVQEETPVVQAPASDPDAAGETVVQETVEEESEDPTGTPVILMTYADVGDDVVGGLKSALGSIFGEYTPNTYTQVVINADGTTESYEIVPDGLAGVDWEWIGGLFLFGIMLYCLLRLLGGVLK